MTDSRLRYASFSCLLSVILAPAWLEACPFCSAPAQTLSEEIQAADAVVMARLKSGPEQAASSDEQPATAETTDVQSGKATFEIIKILKGGEHVAGKKELETIFFGQASEGTTFLITGLGAPALDWTTPLPLSPAAAEYVEKLASVPAKGADRLAYYQNYLENEEPMLAQDAYDEFARAPYAELIELKQRMNHDQLVAWVTNLDVAPSRRRLYLTMLGVCGSSDDLAMLEEMIRSDDRKVKMGLDALIGCYLNLKGADGLSLINEMFLKNSDTPYQDTYAAVMALRILGQETDEIPRDRILESMRLLLDHPELADQVIPDLARWEDWSVMDRLVELFKTTDEQSRWVRIPVVNYLRACSKQDNETGRKAQAAIDQLAELDPESVRRADMFSAFGALAGAAPANSDTKASGETQQAASETPQTPAGPPKAQDKTAASVTGTPNTRSDQPEDTGVVAASAKPGVSSDRTDLSDRSDASSPAASVLPVESTEPATSETADQPNEPRAIKDIAAARSEGRGPAGESASGGLTEQSRPEVATPRRLLLVTIPLVCGLGLVLLLWLILRRTGEQTVS